MERLCRYIRCVVETLIVLAFVIITLPVRLLDKIVYSR